ncbi:hypothetical protein ACLOJK_035043, partial [Asimina triloba]
QQDDHLVGACPQTPKQLEKLSTTDLTITTRLMNDPSSGTALKRYLQDPPLITKSHPTKTLLLYLTISASVVSFVLVSERPDG